MVIAVRAVLVALVKVAGILAKALFALFACKCDFDLLLQGMCFGLGMAFGAIIPLAAAGRADGDLSVEDVFAGRVWVNLGWAGTVRDGTHHMFEMRISLSVGELEHGVFVQVLGSAGKWPLNCGSS